MCDDDAPANPESIGMELYGIADGKLNRKQSRHCRSVLRRRAKKMRA